MKQLISLKRILTFNFLVVALVPLLVSGVFVYSSISSSLEEEISKKNQMLAESVAREIERSLDYPLRLLQEIKVFCGSESIVSEAHTGKILNNIYISHDVFETIMVLDSKGTVSALAPYDENLIGIDVSYQKYYLAQKKQQKPQWSKTFISPKTGRPTLTLTVPFDQGMAVGFLNLKYLETISQKVHMGNAGYVAVSDSEGITIAHFDEKLVAERMNAGNLLIISEGMKGKAGTYRYIFEGVEKIGSIAVVSQTGWVVVITQPLTEAFAPVSRIRNIFLGTMLTAIFVAVIVAFICQRVTLKPLEKLTKDTKLIASGNSSLSLKPQTYAEMAVLEDSFIKMLGALKSRENALRESELNFRTLVNNVPGAVYCCACDKDWTISYISEKVENLSGYPATDFIDSRVRSFASVIHPEDKQRVEDVIMQCVKKGESFAIEYRVVHPDGTSCWVLDRGQAVYDASGEETFINGVVLDCNERKEAEKALQQSEEKLLITLNSIGDAVIATNVEGRIERMNPVAEQLTGWSAEEAVGLLFDETFLVVKGGSGESITGLVSTVIDNGKAAGIPEGSVMIARDGTERTVANSGSPIRNAAGEIVGAVLVFRDITEQVTLESRIRQAEKMESIGRLAGGVAHDFNNMLGGIINAAELLSLEIGNNKKARDYVGIIIKASERVADLTGKLLSFSRKGMFISNPVSLHKIVEDAIDILRHSLDKRIKIETNLAAEKFTILGDTSQLQNAIMNLGVNANDAVPQGGTLTLSTKNVSLDSEHCEDSTFTITPGMYVMLSVKDNGMGMSAEVQKKIFEPFFTTKKEGEGTGLGLAAVYGTIKDHSGAIYVQSEEGKGTEFQLYFPLTEEEAAFEIHDDLAIDKSKGTILVIDDEDIIRQTAVLMLEALGYEVLAAKDGQEALQLYKDVFPSVDLVLLDMVMPNMNGPEAFSKIRDFDPHAKIVLSSGFTKNDTTVNLIEKGAAGFIKKPYRYKALADILSTALGA